MLGMLQDPLTTNGDASMLPRKESPLETIFWLRSSQPFSPKKPSSPVRGFLPVHRVAQRRTARRIDSRTVSSATPGLKARAAASVASAKVLILVDASYVVHQLATLEAVVLLNLRNELSALQNISK